MALNIEELLSRLEGTETEKTASETFVENITEEKEVEEKVAEAEKEKETKEETKEKVAETEEKTEEKTTEEKVAETTTEEKTEEKEKTAESKDVERLLAKYAEDMGKIAAHSFYAELVALGIMPPTNKDVMIPPISQISLPSESPVTMATQMQKKAEKTASFITPEFLTNLHKKLYSEE